MLVSVKSKFIDAFMNLTEKKNTKIPFYSKEPSQHHWNLDTVNTKRTKFFFFLQQIPEHYPSCEQAGGKKTPIRSI